jgi:hypothetical protein
MAGDYRWTFKARFRARAFGWRGSKIAIARLKEAVSEIKAVNRTDPVAAGEGAVVLMERLWPTFQEIDSSSGALGTAVNAALKEIIPIMIAAPAMPKVRASWLERLYQAVQKDGVQYLYPAEERWGDIAVFPELMNEYADLLLPLLRRVWCNEPPGGYVIGGTICLSCLHRLARPRVAGLPCRAGSDRERAEARQPDLVTSLQRVGDCREQAIDRLLGILCHQQPELTGLGTRWIDRFCGGCGACGVVGNTAVLSIKSTGLAASKQFTLPVDGVRPRARQRPNIAPDVADRRKRRACRRGTRAPARLP